jgi:pimeloyl-ACP methyl ester carboxylesterase
MRTILRSVAHDANLGRRDGHPVLILPGYAADDWSTAPLRLAVRSQGYWAHGWRLGRNVGPTARVVAGLRVRVEQLRQAHGRRVSVVGWSLGGVYARALARERPELVRQVITLGSPYRSFENSPAPLAVPATSIYTRTDGVTSWQLCIDRTGPRAENIEVYGTHTGLGVNPAVILAVLDRLGQPEDDWRPFRPPWWAHCSYPEPETWSADARPSA